MSKRGVSTWNAPVESKASSGHKTQVCPHGSSFPCSQCILGANPGVVQVQKVVYDAARGLTVDGKLVRKSLLPEVELRSIQEDLSRKMTRSAVGKRETTCGQCGQVGHTRKTCSQRSRLLREEPIRESEMHVNKKTNRVNRCGECGEPGHNAATCDKKTVFPEAA